MRLSEMLMIMFVVGIVITGLITFSTKMITSNPDSLANYSAGVNTTMGRLVNLSEDIQQKLGTNETSLQTGEEVSFAAVPEAFNILQKLVTATPDIWFGFISVVAQSVNLPEWFTGYLVAIVVFVVVVAGVRAIFKWYI